MYAWFGGGADVEGGVARGDGGWVFGGVARGFGGVGARFGDDVVDGFLHGSERFVK